MSLWSLCHGTHHLEMGSLGTAQWASGPTKWPFVAVWKQFTQRHIANTQGPPFPSSSQGLCPHRTLRSAQYWVGPDAGPHPPLCDIPSGCCFFTGPWTVTRSYLHMLRRIAAFCRPLRPVLLLVSFPPSLRKQQQRHCKLRKEHIFWDQLRNETDPVVLKWEETPPGVVWTKRCLCKWGDLLFQQI